MEVPCAHHDLCFWKNERVIRSAVGFRFENPPDVTHDFTGGPVNLGDASERIGILHSGVTVPMRLPDLRIPQEGPETPRRFHLTRMGTDSMGLLSERFGRALEPLQGHGSRHFRSLQGYLSPIEREDSDPCRGLSPVDEGETLFFLERKGRDTHLFQDIGCLPRDPPELHLSLPEDRQSHMGQGREISARPHRSSLRHLRVDPQVQVVQEALNDYRANPGMPPGEGIHPQDHYGPDLLPREGLADPGRVAPDEVPLELFPLLRWNHYVRQTSESSGHAIDLAGF